MLPGFQPIPRESRLRFVWIGHNPLKDCLYLERSLQPHALRGDGHRLAVFRDLINTLPQHLSVELGSCLDCVRVRLASKAHCTWWDTRNRPSVKINDRTSPPIRNDGRRPLRDCLAILNRVRYQEVTSIRGFALTGPLTHEMISKRLARSIRLPTIVGGVTFNTSGGLYGPKRRPKSSVQLSLCRQQSD